MIYYSDKNYNSAFFVYLKLKLAVNLPRIFFQRTAFKIALENSLFDIAEVLRGT